MSTPPKGIPALQGREEVNNQEKAEETLTNKTILAATVAGSMLFGGALGLVVFGPSLANAADNPAATTAPPAAPNGSGSSTFKGNEDPAHEANESKEREAQEDSGQGFRGGHGGGHGSNEDPAHEANESKEREAQEDAERNSQPNGGTQPNTSAPDVTSQ
jgi:hypothetical protein